jgi:2-dehydro-3-deoxygluconokinase
MSEADSVILCIGEALITLSPADGQLLETSRSLQVSAGGAEFNVAVQLARLGLASRFAGMVGADPWGRKLVDVLEGEGVDSASVLIHPSRPTGCYLKELKPEGSSVYYYRARSAASAFGRLPRRAHDHVAHVHLSGITPALSRACAGLVRNELDQAGSRTTSFDINYRPGLWRPQDARSVLLELARKATYVFVGLDEAHELWGCGTAEEIRDLFAATAELIVKDGPREAVAFTSHGSAAATPDPVEVVDVIGAGDAFAAGYLASRLGGAIVESALRAGHAVAAAVIGSSTDHGCRAQVAALAPLLTEAPGAS